MLTEERQQIILNQLSVRKVLSVSELSTILQTSDVTVRRDLKELAERGLLNRTHGGATYINFGGTSYEPMLSDLAAKNREQKQMICREAVKLVMDNTAILLDASSTVRTLCRELLQRDWTQLTVVTNSLDAASCMALKSGVQVVMVGGTIRRNLLCTGGSFAEELLGRLKVDICFMGINGITFSDMSVTTPNLTECAIKRAMVQCGQKNVLLADHTKFGKSFLGKVCSLDRFDRIITDAGVSEEVMSQAMERGLPLVCAG